MVGFHIHSTHCNGYTAHICVLYSHYSRHMHSNPCIVRLHNMYYIMLRGWIGVKCCL